MRPCLNKTKQKQTKKNPKQNQNTKREASGPQKWNKSDRKPLLWLSWWPRVQINTIIDMTSIEITLQIHTDTPINGIVTYKTRMLLGEKQVDTMERQVE